MVTADPPVSEPDPRAAGLPYASCFSRPSLLLEQRATFELAQLFASPVYYGIGVPRGDGGPVLLIPGFLGSDSYLTIMQSWLTRIGYRSYLSGLALNAGRPIDLIGRMLRRADEVAEHAGRPITIVGHSLGGVFGSVLGRLRPDIVEQVITLGSPLSGDPRRAAHPLVAALGNVLLTDHSSPAAMRDERALELALFAYPLPERVRLTCIFTREDAVVHWRACIADDENTESHEVRGTHCGLAWNAGVYQHIGRTLPMAA